MKNEVIGMCPSCISKKGKERMVDIYVARNDKGDITAMYIFGDDDFDMPSRNCDITDFKVSEDGKTITEIVCPRCKERIAVSVPVILEPAEKVEQKPDFASLYADLNARQQNQ